MNKEINELTDKELNFEFQQEFSIFKNTQPPDYCSDFNLIQPYLEQFKSDDVIRNSIEIEYEHKTKLWYVNLVKYNMAYTASDYSLAKAAMKVLLVEKENKK